MSSLLQSGRKREVCYPDRSCTWNARLLPLISITGYRKHGALNHSTWMYPISCYRFTCYFCMLAISRSWVDSLNHLMQKQDRWNGSDFSCSNFSAMRSVIRSIIAASNSLKLHFYSCTNNCFSVPTQNAQLAAAGITSLAVPAKESASSGRNRGASKDASNPAKGNNNPTTPFHPGPEVYSNRVSSSPKYSSPSSFHVNGTCHGFLVTYWSVSPSSHPTIPGLGNRPPLKICGEDEVGRGRE